MFDSYHHAVALHLDYIGVITSYWVEYENGGVQFLELCDFLFKAEAGLIKVIQP